MNHLAHFALSRRDAPLMIGSFLGDYVKGRLQGQYPDDIERGIRLHRAIDAYTDAHDIVRSAGARFDPAYRRYAGIMTDVIFDHFLAQAWQAFYDEPLETFSADALSTLVQARSVLPDRAAATAARMHQYNSLAGYGSDDFLIGAFNHLGTRLTRSNPLPGAFDEFQLHREGLREDFSAFYPELLSFVDDWLAAASD